MKAVGIRELKNNLSRYVAEVRRGEVVVVTDRGRVVAELRRPTATHPTAIPAGLDALAARGEVRLGLPHDPDLYVTLEPCGPEGLAGELLDEERGER